MQNNLNPLQNQTKKQQESQIFVQNKLIKNSTYKPGQKNGKWSQQQHMKYIAFIDFYKDKMRSKQKRKSNQFYNQMSHFISTRNGLQCRSHHQKLEEKYIYTNKIITFFKEKFDMQEYKKILTKLKKDKGHKHNLLQGKTFQTLPNQQIKQTKDAEVQTELGSLQLNYFLMGQNNVIFYPLQQNMSLDQQFLFYIYPYIISSNP